MVHIPQIRVRHPRHMTVLLVASPVLVVAAVLGFVAGVGSGTGVPIALAATSWPITYCGPDDYTVTTGLSVYHVKSEGEYLREVEPNTTDTWDIDLTWSSAYGSACPGVDFAWANVTATVTWTDGVGWSASCTGCDAISGPVHRVSVCDAGSCGAATNGWAYKLILDVASSAGVFLCPVTQQPVMAYLSLVDYTTTSVNNGNLVYTATCTEGTAVSPTSQTWSQTDYPIYDCSFDCNASGASVVIQYQ
jgi:hypothetical protein